MQWRAVDPYKCVRFKRRKDGGHEPHFGLLDCLGTDDAVLVLDVICKSTIWTVVQMLASAQALTTSERLDDDTVGENNLALCPGRSNLSAKKVLDNWVSLELMLDRSQALDRSFVGFSQDDPVVVLAKQCLDDDRLLGERALRSAAEGLDQDFRRRRVPERDDLEVEGRGRSRMTRFKEDLMSEPRLGHQAQDVGLFVAHALVHRGALARM